MMPDLFNENNHGEGSPALMPTGASTPNLSQYRYRVERFALGNSDEDDEGAALERLLTRSISPTREVVIVDRKDSISATTGVYTCVIIYMERIPGGNTNA